MSSGKWRPFCLDLNVLRGSAYRYKNNPVVRPSIFYLHNESSYTGKTTSYSVNIVAGYRHKKIRSNVLGEGLYPSTLWGRTYDHQALWLAAIWCDIVLNGWISHVISWILAVLYRMFRFIMRLICLMFGYCFYTYSSTLNVSAHGHSFFGQQIG